MRTLPFVLIAAVFAVSLAGSEARPRWFVTLYDDSRLAFTPQASMLSIDAEMLGAPVVVPLVSVREIDLGEGEKVSVTLKNGDRITGSFAGGKVLGSTVFGALEIRRKDMKRIEVVPTGAAAATAADSPGEFQLKYNGLLWDLWRTGWKVEDGWLTAQRHARPGFRYGHWANGRGGTAIAANGDRAWTDYEVSFDYKMLAANREFYHAHIPGESRGMSVFLRAESLTESWNQPDTAYVFSINPNGSWGLSARDGWHMPGDGWSSTNRKGKSVKLASGKAEACEDASEGRLRLRVVGDTITVWLGEEKLVDFTHEGGEIDPIRFGGFGVRWRYESVGRIGKMEVERL